MADQAIMSRNLEQTLSDKARRLLAAHDREVEARESMPARSGAPVPASMSLQPA